MFRIDSSSAYIPSTPSDPAISTAPILAGSMSIDQSVGPSDLGLGFKDTFDSGPLGGQFPSPVDLLGSGGLLGAPAQLPSFRASLFNSIDPVGFSPVAPFAGLDLDAFPGVRGHLLLDLESGGGSKVKLPPPHYGGGGDW